MELVSDNIYGAILNVVDLMLPGVGIPEAGLAEFEKGDVLSMRVGNSSPLAIGIASINSSEFVESGYEMKGKAMEILHTVDDYLFTSGDTSVFEAQEAPVSIEKDSFNTLENEKHSEESVEAVAEQLESIDISENAPISTQDELLEMSLFTAIKYKLDDDKLFPIAASQFMENYLIPCRKPGTLLDLKASSHKKVTHQ